MVTDLQIKKLKNYFKEMPVDEIISGILKVGRKSILKKEVHSVTAEQALWRLKNWKMMIANYRRRGYSYPTISRIKKHLILISKNGSKL